MDYGASFKTTGADMNMGGMNFTAGGGMGQVETNMNFDFNNALSKSQIQD